MIAAGQVSFHSIGVAAFWRCGDETLIAIKSHTAILTIHLPTRTKWFLFNSNYEMTMRETPKYLIEMTILSFTFFYASRAGEFKRFRWRCMQSWKLMMWVFQSVLNRFFKVDGKYLFVTEINLYVHIFQWSLEGKSILFNGMSWWSSWTTNLMIFSNFP